MKSVILGNADIYDYSLIKSYTENAELTICCDGGMRHAYNMGIIPDVIIGDLDSASKEHVSHYENLNVKFYKYPSHKDASDMELCIDYAIEFGVESIIILGGIGSRLDHTLSNIFLLKKGFQHNIDICIANEKNNIRLIDKEIELKGNIGDLVSILPITPTVTGVVTQGLYYPLKSETLYIDSSRGISNNFCSQTASIKISSGLLLVIRSAD